MMIRIGGPLKPRKWFLLPMPVIEQAIEKNIEENLGIFGTIQWLRRSYGRAEKQMSDESDTV